MARTRSRLAPLVGIALAAAGAHAQDGAAPEQVVFSADSWARSGNTYTIRGPTIEGGDLRIEAEQAVTTSLEFDGRWELTGSISMSVGTARLLADSARFRFAAGELATGELAGDPATFEDTAPAQPGAVRGEASRIVYDREAGTVRMEGSATFTHGQNSMSGCDFLYELDGGLVSGSSECGVPLSIIYVPPSEDDAADDASANGADTEGEGSSPIETPPAP